MQMTLTELKALTIDQYERARARALDRVKARIGDKPARATFAREAAPIASLLDWIALVVFVAALAISSAHIIHYMGDQASESYKASASAGIVLSEQVWAWTHQLGAILLAEAAAILFMTMHSMSAPARASRPAWTRWLSVPLVLAGTAAIFVFAANLSSGVNFLVSVMPPLFTLGIAVRLEAIIVETIRRRSEIDSRYIDAITIYETASADPEKHPDYRKLLQQEVWSALSALKSNEPYRDAPAGFKRAAVQREMARYAWADAGELVTAFDAPAPLPAPRRRKADDATGETVPFGVDRPDRDADDDTAPMLTVSAPTGDAKAQRGGE